MQAGGLPTAAHDDARRAITPDVVGGGVGTSLKRSSYSIDLCYGPVALAGSTEKST